MNDVVVFDPGPHCGVAWIRAGQIVKSETVSDSTEYGRTWQYRRLRNFVIAEENVLAMPTVVIESYHTVMPLGRDALATIKLIGWIEGLALCYGMPVIFQAPAAKKPFLAEAKSRYHGADVHAGDAIAHALAYLAAQSAAPKKS